MAIFIGDRPRLTCTATTAATPLVLTDPTTLTVTVTPPLGASTVKAYPADPEVVRVSVGVFYLLFTVAERGMHQVRWVAAGALVKADQTAFTAAAINTR